MRTSLFIAALGGAGLSIRIDILICLDRLAYISTTFIIEHNHIVNAIGLPDIVSLPVIKHVVLRHSIRDSDYDVHNHEKQ